MSEIISKKAKLPLPHFAARYCAFLGALCFFVGFVLVSVGFAAYNSNFYNREFEKYSAAERGRLSEQGLAAVRDKMINYFSGKDDELQIYVQFLGDSQPGAFFTEDELSHMDDVKVVFVAVKTTAVVLLIVGAALLGAGAFLAGGDIKFRIYCLARAAMQAMAAVFAALCVVALAALIDFDTVFVLFHGLFFPQGNWRFPSNSNMLQILPEGLFMDAALLIIAWGLGFTLVLGAAGAAFCVYYKKRHRQINSPKE